MIYLESGLSENIKQGTKYMWYTNGHANENILKSKPSPVHEVGNFHFGPTFLIYPCI